jgi:hypothetical protein
MAFENGGVDSSDTISRITTRIYTHILKEMNKGRLYSRFAAAYPYQVDFVHAIFFYFFYFADGRRMWMTSPGNVVVAKGISQGHARELYRKLAYPIVKILMEEEVVSVPCSSRNSNVCDVCERGAYQMTTAPAVPYCRLSIYEDLAKSIVTRSNLFRAGASW